MSLPAKEKIAWISILQGWSMLLVVIGHVTLTNRFQDPAMPFNAAIERIIYSFHMPLFMFLSGFLFYKTQLKKEKKYKEIIKNKAKRLLIPFAVFSFVTFFLKYAFNPLMKRPVTFSWRELFDIILFTSNPLGEMWFISTLFIIFLISFLFRWSLNNKITIVIMLTAGMGLNLFFPSTISIFCLSHTAYYFVFFYAGISFSGGDAKSMLL